MRKLERAEQQPGIYLAEPAEPAETTEKGFWNRLGSTRKMPCERFKKQAPGVEENTSAFSLNAFYKAEGEKQNFRRIS